VAVIVEPRDRAPGKWFPGPPLWLSTGLVGSADGSPCPNTGHRTAVTVECGEWIGQRAGRVKVADCRSCVIVPVTVDVRPSGRTTGRRWGERLGEIYDQAVRTSRRAAIGVNLPPNVFMRGSGRDEEVGGGCGERGNACGLVGRPAAGFNASPMSLPACLWDARPGSLLLRRAAPSNWKCNDRLHKPPRTAAPSLPYPSRTTSTATMNAIALSSRLYAPTAGSVVTNFWRTINRPYPRRCVAVSRKPAEQKPKIRACTCLNVCGLLLSSPGNAYELRCEP